MFAERVTGVAVVLFVVVLASVSGQSTYSRSVLTGNDIVLPCDYNQGTDGDWILVAWTVLMDGTFRNLFVRTTASTDNSVTPPDQFVGRVSIDGVTSLRLTGVTIADEDEYRCTVTATNSPVTNVNLQVFKQPTTGPAVQVQYYPPASDTSKVPLNTTVTFTCTSTGGRPPADLTWAVTKDGTPVSVTPTYTTTNDSQGVGDATSTFNFTTTEYSVTYNVQCTASGPDPIQSRTSAITSFTTEPDPSVTTSNPQGQTGGGGIGTGAIVGIVIGVIAALALTAALVYFLLIREKKPGKGKEDGVESGDADVTYHATGHPGAPENMSRPPPNQPEVMYAELDLEKQPAGSRRPYVATPDDPPTEYASIRPNKPPRSSVPHTLAPDEKSEYASVSKPGTRY